MNKRKSLIIAIDFDGTIVEDHFPEIGNLITQAIETITQFKESGHKLILWTCREDSPKRLYLTEAVDFCSELGLEFDAVNENISDSPYAHMGQGRKVYADHYFDDKALFPAWNLYAGGML